MTNYDEITPCESIPDFHSAVTIQLKELINDGVFSWNLTSLTGCFDALGNENATRLQEMFVERFMYREIGIIPPGKWFQKLGYKIKFQLVPKYKPLYDAIADGDFSPLYSENEYHKRRNVNSDFPETLLDQNQVYLSDGTDIEYQTIRTASGLEALEKFQEVWASVDDMLMSELEVLFMDLYTVNYNGF